MSSIALAIKSKGACRAVQVDCLAARLNGCRQEASLGLVVSVDVRNDDGEGGGGEEESGR